jgi:S1-C subfamily serine protease
VGAHLRKAAPFALGVVAALAGMALYSVLTPQPAPLTEKQVSTVVAQAMASATPPPSYSALAYRAVQPSLVLIQTGARRVPGADGNIADPVGVGSGVVISAEGQILTALHVVEGAADITVTFADGFESSAQIIASQPENDIAVLQPEELPEIVVPAVMGNPGALRVGDEAFAFGNPFGLYGSLSTGVVSGLNRSFQRDDGAPEIENLIQIDTAVNPGNSGGPLLNRYGQVVGIVVALLNPTEDEFFVGIGFAVPITTAAGAAGAPAY